MRETPPRQDRTHAPSKFGEVMRHVQLACRFRSEVVSKSIVFVSPPTRLWWVMAAPFGGLRNGDDHKNLVHEFSSERGDKPPLELSRSLRVDRKDRPRIDSS